MLDLPIREPRPIGPLDRATAKDATLKGYAVKHGVGMGRLRDEPVPDAEGRTRFAIDVCRANYAESFKALAGKAQIHSTTVPERVTSRGSHSADVATLAHYSAEELSLNPDLMRAQAMLHDIGHPPFAHKGETALDDWARAKSGGRVRFEHNEQTIRVVTILEDMNPNVELLEALDKHGSYYRRPDGWRMHMEGQAGDLMDSMSYYPCDIRESIRHRILDVASLMEVDLFRTAFERSRETRRGIESELIKSLKSHLLAETSRQIEKHRIESLEDVRRAPENIVRLPRDIAVQKAAMKKIMYAHVYIPAEEQPYREAIGAILTAACEHLHDRPDEWVLRYETLGNAALPHDRRVRAVLDAVSRLTDREAVALAQKAGVNGDTISVVHRIFNKRIARDERENEQ